MYLYSVFSKAALHNPLSGFPPFSTVRIVYPRTRQKRIVLTTPVRHSFSTSTTTVSFQTLDVFRPHAEMILWTRDGHLPSIESGYSLSQESTFRIWPRPKN